MKSTPPIILKCLLQVASACCAPRTHVRATYKCIVLTPCAPARPYGLRGKRSPPIILTSILQVASAYSDPRTLARRACKCPGLGRISTRVPTLPQRQTRTADHLNIYPPSTVRPTTRWRERKRTKSNHAGENLHFRKGTRGASINYSKMPIARPKCPVCF